MALVEQPSVPAIDVIGDDRKHAPFRFNHPIGKRLANANPRIACGSENSCATLVSDALETEHLAVKKSRRFKILCINPANLGADAGIVLLQVATPNRIKALDPGVK